MFPSLSAAVISTVMAALVFFLPIADVYAMMYAAALFDGAEDHLTLFYAYIYAVPAVLGAVTSFVLGVVTLRILDTSRFGISVIVPCVTLSVLSTFVGRYHFDEALVFCAAVIFAVLLRMKIIRRQDVETVDSLQDA